MRDARAATVAAVAAAAVVASQTAGKVTRDTLLLATEGAAALPRAMLLAAGLSLIGGAFFTRLQVRRGPAGAVPAVLLASAALFGIETLARPWLPGPTAVVVYVHVSVVGVTAISGLWAAVTERFDPQAARQRIGRVAVGASIGGVLGGMLAERVATELGAGHLLTLLCLLSLVSAALVARLGRGPRPASAAPRRSSVAVLRASPYLRRIATVAIALAVASALADVALKAEADARLHSEAELASFFSVYHATVGAVTLLGQTLLTGRLLRRFGVVTAVAVLPAALLALGGAALALPRLATLALWRGGAAVLDNALHRPGYELLYAPLAPCETRPVKTWIDVAGVRVGEALAAGVAWALALVVAPPLAVQATVAFAALAALAALAAVRRLPPRHAALFGRSAPSAEGRQTSPWTQRPPSRLDDGALGRALRAPPRRRTLRALAQLPSVLAPPVTPVKRPGEGR